MKKIFLTIVMTFIVTLSAMADDKSDALKFFNNYVNAANTYSDSVTKMYSPTAKIIRQVVKPDGTTVDVNTDTATYIRQMKIAQAGAKIRNYKNFYSDVKVTKIANGKCKIASNRQPIGETYKLKTYMIVQKQPNKQWLIVEEMMQTKQQIFLKYAK